MRCYTASLAAGLLAGFCLTSVTACGDDGGGPTGSSDCNPLGYDGDGCLDPWPSSAFLREDDTTATGLRVDLPAGGMPSNIDRSVIDPTPWNRLDGFSPSGAVVATFPAGVSAEGLPGHDDLSESQAADAAVAIVDMETGERVVLFAEVDMNVEPDKRALIIRPLERLQGGTRYAVAIRNTVKAADGSAIERSPGFQAIIDGTSFDHPRFAALAAGYPAIFESLAAAGFAKDDLLLAWDFTTASDDSMTADLLSMRDQALDAMGDKGANLGFALSERSGSALTYKLFEGTFDAPNFLSDGESKDSKLLRNADDSPRLDGMYSANVAIIIPTCVTTATLPLEVMVFGHGLFGSALGYLDDDFLQQVANDNCVVVVGTDWIGLSERQLSDAAFAANDLNRVEALSDKLGQAVINFIALENLVRGPLGAAPEMQLDGAPILDPSRVYYLGGSLGGIMGGTFMAYDPTILRGVLGVPGGAWSLLIERSAAWAPLQVAASAAYEDPHVYQLLVSLLSSSLERWDPITTARRVVDDPMPGTPAKQLLMYETLNDSLVSNLSTEMVVRTMGLPVTGPSVRMPFGLSETTDPASSALTIYDEHPSPAVPDTNVPPAEDNGTHSGINKKPTVLRAAVHFLRQGEVINECLEGATAVACDCSTGVCDIGD